MPIRSGHPASSASRHLAARRVVPAPGTPSFIMPGRKYMRKYQQKFVTTYMTQMAQRFRERSSLPHGTCTVSACASTRPTSIVRVSAVVHRGMLAAACCGRITKNRMTTQKARRRRRATSPGASESLPILSASSTQMSGVKPAHEPGRHPDDGLGEPAVATRGTSCTGTSRCSGTPPPPRRRTRTE